MGKLVRAGTGFVELDPNFEPEKWVDEGDPHTKGDRKELREALDLTQDEEVMGQLLNELRNEPAGMREKLMGIEAEAMGIDDDSSEARQQALKRRVDGQMVLSNLSLSDLPEYAQKILRRRA